MSMEAKDSTMRHASCPPERQSDRNARVFAHWTQTGRNLHAVVGRSNLWSASSTLPQLRSVQSDTADPGYSVSYADKIGDCGFADSAFHGATAFFDSREPEQTSLWRPRTKALPGQRGHGQLNPGRNKAARPSRPSFQVGYDRTHSHVPHLQSERSRRRRGVGTIWAVLLPLGLHCRHDCPDSNRSG